MRIKLAENFRAVFYAPFYAALELDFYRQEGVEVKFIASPAPGAQTAGLLDGSVDVAWGGPMRVMKARDQPAGPPLVCFCEVVCRDPFYLVGQRRAREFKLRELAGLKFASVCEVPTPWLCLQHDLRERGIDASAIERITDRTMPQNLEALGRGEIDVAQLFEPYASMAVRRGVGVILHAASRRGLTSYTTLLATRAGFARLRTELACMERAIGRMQAWLYQHSAAELAALVAPYFKGVAPDDLASALRNYKDAGLWARSTRISREGFERLALSLRSGGFISRAPDYDDCVADCLP